MMPVEGKFWPHLGLFGTLSPKVALVPMEVDMGKPFKVFILVNIGHIGTITFIITAFLLTSQQFVMTPHFGKRPK